MTFCMCHVLCTHSMTLILNLLLFFDSIQCSAKHLKYSWLILFWEGFIRRLICPSYPLPSQANQNLAKTFKQILELFWEIHVWMINRPGVAGAVL